MTMVETPKRTTRTPTSQSAARRLQTSFAAVKVSFTWLGVRKTLTSDQKAQAAEPFGAEGQYLSAGKKLLDTRDEHYKAVTSLRNRIGSYWKSLSLPFPEPGLRLIRQDDIASFDRQMHQFRDELNEAVANLDARLETLKADAQIRLGKLYNPGDYPTSLIGLFGVAWEFPSVQAPDYLKQLRPELYEQECQRVQTRFSEAVKLAEEAFTSELAKLIEHLTERLSAGPEGGHKVFRDSAITNLTEFFGRFKTLNIRSNAELDGLVETAQKVVQGISPEDVRNSDQLRQQVTTQLAAVQSTLDQMLVDAPRRRILRPLPPTAQVA